MKFTTHNNPKKHRNPRRNDPTTAAIKAGADAILYAGIKAHNEKITGGVKNDNL